MAIIRVEVEEKVVVSDDTHVGVDVLAPEITDEMVERAANRFFELCAQSRSRWLNNIEVTKWMMREVLLTAEKMRRDKS